ncbi:putative elongator complex protein 1 [Thecaphora frezii]
MRNLSILAQRSFPLEAQDVAGAIIQATAFSTEDDTLYAVAVSRASPTSPNVKLTFLRRYPLSLSLYSFASLVTPAALPPLEGSASSVAQPQHTSRPENQIVSLHFLADGGSAAQHHPALCAITAGGDIIILPLQDEPVAEDVPAPDPEIVGSVEQGLLAASWSPDDELLVLVTAETTEEAPASGRRQPEKLLLMTREFEVLSEAQLCTDDFGEERPVDVGWGSKATQFHGSEGKAAAAAAAAAAATAKPTVDTRGPRLPDDDGRPRISWRGDGAFFAISSLEPFRSPVAEVDAAPTWHRLIRTYARLGALSATSDPAVRGISQALAFRPIGNLIASTQRFGPSASGEPWQTGRAGRHDVVFFERNGLRHGEFSLREERPAQPQGLQLGWGDAQSVEQWTRTHFVRDLCWNADGSALAVWLTRISADAAGASVDVVQVWTTGNYHWYLKQEIVVPAPIQQIKWHPENPHDLVIAQADVVERRVFCLETSASGGRPPFDAACVAVADGSATLLTPFRMQNVPPPMCTTALLSPPVAGGLPNAYNACAVPVHSCWTQLASVQSQVATGLLALLYQSGHVQLWLFEWGVMGGRSRLGGRPVPEPRLVGTVDMVGLVAGDSAVSPIQIAAAGWPSSAAGDDGSAPWMTLAVLVSHGDHDSVLQADLTLSAVGSADAAVKVGASAEVAMPPSGSGKRRIVADPYVPKAGFEPAIYVHSDDGQVWHLSRSEPRQFAALGAFCPTIQMLARPGGHPSCVVGLAPNGRLFAGAHLVAKDATSFTLAGSFLVWTNSAHEARFLPIASLCFDGEPSSNAQVQEEAVDLGRRVERGSRIITAVPSMMALVLQMPRGNLETICPRPLVLEVVRRDLDQQRYGSAFRTCRTHRMDVNILYDHDPESFMSHIDKFVAQVADVDHLNLFLSGLRNEDVTTTLYKPLTRSERASTSNESKVNRICDAMRAELERVDKRRYVNSILTTHVRKVPADYEAGLALLLELKEEDQAMAEEAVKYIIFLADADKLFDLALGMYDFTLTLMVAQHAQRKDPREYLPFLRELRSLEPVEYQRFRIDDHLKRHAKALGWLAKAGKQHHAATLQYMDQHKLYEEALRCFSDDAPRLRDAYDLFGDYLLTRRKPSDAATCFALASKPRKAMRAHLDALQWAEALSIAFAEKLAAAEIVKMGREVAAYLEDKLRWSEAARVVLEYGRDLEQAVHYYCKGNDFSQAHRIAAMHQRLDLVQTHLAPAALESQAVLMEDVDEMSTQLTKQLVRLRELRTKKAEDPAMFYGTEDPALENVDVMSDTSTQATAFTRYTAAPTASAASSMSTFSKASKSTNRKHAAKMKKKEERKKAAGKKGSIYEEDYLYESLQKLVRDRLGGVQQEASKLLPHLATLSSSHRQAGRELQTALSRFEAQAAAAVETLAMFGQEDEQAKLDQLAALEADILKGSLVQAGPTVLAMAVRSVDRRPPRPKLVVAEHKWKVIVLDL